MPSTPHTSSTSAQRLPAGFLAALLPAIVLAIGGWLLLAPEEEQLSPAAQRMEEALAAAQPELLVVGNSLAGRDIDPVALGTSLGERPVRVATAWEPGTYPANWYLFLKNRLYDQGLEPHVIVVAMAPRTLLQTGVEPELASKSLGEHIGPYEPVVFEKVYGRSTPNPWLLRLRNRRGRFQELWAGWMRAGSVGLFHGEPDQPMLERGEAVAGPALERVFEADGAVDITLHQRVIPVVEHEREVAVSADSSTVAASFVPDLLDLAETFGSRVVFVWMPMLPGTEAAMAVDPLVEAELVRLLNERGAAYVDMSGLGYPLSLFQDPAHLNHEGQARFTRELAERLRAIDVMGHGPFAPSRVPLALEHSVELRGSAPDPGPVELLPDPDGQPCLHMVKAAEWYPLSDAALGAAGLGTVSPLVVLEDGQPLEHKAWLGALKGGCKGAYMPQAGRLWVSPGPHAEPPRAQRGYTLALEREQPVRYGKAEGWFVYPGTELRLDFTGWPGEPGALELLVGLEPLMGEPQGASVSLDGAAVPLEPAGSRWLQGRLEAPTPAGPWSVAIASPAGGPWLAVRWLAVRSGEEGVDLMGSAELMEPPAAQLLLGSDRAELEVLTEPAHFPLALEPSGKAGGVRGPLPGLDEIASTHISTRVPCRRCSPLRLVEGGELREIPHLVCGPVRKGKAARSCHADGWFELTPSDGSDPLGNGRGYELQLSPDRWIGRRLWLYPGDRMRLDVAGAERRLLRDGASTLVLEGAAFAGVDPAGQLHLRLVKGDEVLLEASVPVRAFDDGPRELSLGERVDLRGASVVLELSTDPEAPYLLLSGGRLHE